MPTIDVKMPKNVQPVFPNFCIHSYQENPDDVVHIKVPSANPLLIYLPPILVLLVSKLRVEVPILKKYKKHFKRTRFFRKTIDIAIMTVGIFLMFMCSELTGFSNNVNIISGFGIGIVVATMIDMAKPANIDFLLLGNNVTYFFTCEDYATEFIALNKNDVIAVD